MAAKDWRLIFRTSRLVLGIPRYAAVALVTGFLGLNLFVIFQNSTLFFDVVVGGSLPLGNRINVLLGLYPFVGTAYNALESVLLVTVATLFGVNFGLLAYHFREHGVSARESSGSAAGLVLGTLGAGCAACGTAVLAGILSVFGAAGLLTLLPLDGLEFTLLAVVLLILSIFWIARGMRGGKIRGCPIDL